MNGAQAFDAACAVVNGIIAIAAIRDGDRPLLVTWSAIMCGVCVFFTLAPL